MKTELEQRGHGGQQRRLCKALVTESAKPHGRRGRVLGALRTDSPKVAGYFYERTGVPCPVHVSRFPISFRVFRDQLFETYQVLR